MQIARPQLQSSTRAGCFQPRTAAPRARVSARSFRAGKEQVTAPDTAFTIDTDRRAVLAAGAALAVSPLIIVKNVSAAQAYLEVDNLSSFQRSDQRTEFVIRAQGILREILTADDAPAAVRLALHDAGTFDYATKAGGLDGSIILNAEEAGRPENASLSGIVAKLKEAKAAIDAGDKTGAGPISWADTIYLAGKVATQKQWDSVKLASGGKVIVNAFRNPWPVEVGRVDSDAAGGNRVPGLDADVETIRQFLLQLGAKPNGGGFLAPKAPFWERPGFVLWTASAVDPAAEEARFASEQPDKFAGIKKVYDNSRRTTTRTDYEVDFAEFYNKLTSLGATFDKSKYLYRIPVQTI